MWSMTILSKPNIQNKIHKAKQRSNQLIPCPMRTQAAEPTPNPSPPQHRPAQDEPCSVLSVQRWTSGSGAVTNMAGVAPPPTHMSSVYLNKHLLRLPCMW